MNASKRSQTEIALLKQVEAEISSRLNQSLHKNIFVNTLLQPQNQEVKRPWDYEVKLKNQTETIIEPNSSIAEIFYHRAIEERLLILGQPGSGKTTTMLDLAKVLLELAEDPNAPIPVLVDLRSWATKQQSIPDWLAVELNLKYGLRRDVTKKWIDKQKLLPLLDGFDEVRDDLLEVCTQALNHWISGNAGYSAPRGLVVCSRIEAYELLETPLQINGAVFLKELSPTQIEQYLESVEEPSLISIIENNPSLKDLARSPLFLSMMIIASQNCPQELENFPVPDDAKEFLIDIYVSQMLERSENYHPWQMKPWLVWLAQQMELENQTEFLVKRIQPSWLRHEKLNRKYRFREKLLVGLLVGLLGCLLFWLLFGPEFNEIEPKNDINQGVWNSLGKGLLLGLPLGLLLVPGLLIMLMFGPGVGLLFVLPLLVVGLPEGQLPLLLFGLLFGLLLGLLFGLLFELLRGGGLRVYLKHLVLRHLLYANGFAPWNYTRFLISCSDCSLLQQVGGRFRFIHHTVKVHFATMQFKKLLY